MVDKRDWIWMPHPAHLCIASDCQFHLATKVGRYIVSTVGEYFPQEGVREIMAQHRGITLEGRGDAREADFMRKLGFQEIGYNRKYETMVFTAKPNDEQKCGCPFVIDSGCEMEMDAYNDPEDAYRGHVVMCEKYAAMD